MQSQSLAGRVALVVGGGQEPGGAVGMGRAAAVTLARAGARVIVGDRNPTAAEETAEAIRTEGGTASTVTIDVSDEDSIAAALGDVEETEGRLDVLHNNVGVSVGAGDSALASITPEVFDRVTNINLRGMVLTCKHAIPLMARSGGGSIISVGSTAPMTHYEQIAYKTSKAGVIAMSENIAWFHAGEGIRSNVVIPGLIDTPMAIDTRVRLSGRPREELIEERSRKIPLGRKIGTAWDVADAVLFFASDQSSFVTGQHIVVDGGWTLQVG
ncbi:SDR family NAD(P)-dependent oxidoreductase [Microbacterium pseudoresistens]|uniref:NAD(P)-dependent dehydrogenase (Short-subunit alcohol dehydrogenase family) n=1 Tax=Microbacterium pseudoresistens TaxID=640634 RepID=A0A7Y9EW96_9MICO|nr:SDR family NAD(P)-dependent oxidoreductase [Microbacterium pseudoresistens]NYD54245.1 NAD(P)-dependent dehydrogenase (short-subunit alcohol dehydrogenase family) [Microbacterium pseudoresistens]